MLFPPALRRRHAQMPCTLQLAGKRPGGFKLMAVSNPPGDSHSCLLTIRYTSSRRLFLVDTGAQVSVVPVSPHEPYPPASASEPTHLRSANGGTIKVHYSMDSTLHFAGRRFHAHLLHAEVSFPPLGADILRRHHFLVNVRNQRLVDTRLCQDRRS